MYEGLVEVVGLAMPNHPIMIKPGFYTQIENDRPPQSPREMRALRDQADESEGESPLQRNQGTGDEGERNVPQGTNPAQSARTRTAATQV